MPRVYQVKSTKAEPVSVAYTIDGSVGPGCQNAREDVLLVQHLLRRAWQDCPRSKGFRPPGETQPLKADGIPGPTTNRFIKFFQEECVRRGANVTQDGRVDPVKSGASTSGGSHSFYTILAMNSARNSRQMGNQDDITSDPEFPQELRKHFFIDW
ncbi:MAG: hypothetical protein ABWZ80_03010 [Beijerinckiaceae bacterium]